MTINPTLVPIPLQSQLCSKTEEAESDVPRPGRRLRVASSRKGACLLCVGLLPVAIKVPLTQPKLIANTPNPNPTPLTSSSRVREDFGNFSRRNSVPPFEQSNKTGLLPKTFPAGAPATLCFSPTVPSQHRCRGATVARSSSFLRYHTHILTVLGYLAEPTS